MIDNSNFPNTYFFKNKLLSLNAVESHVVYGERLYHFSQKEYREWNVMRSKLGAGIKKGIENFGIKRDSLCLYLGAASGTTVSHVSDILDQGFVFAVEFSAQPFSKLLNEAKLRSNVIPILSDANKTENYLEIVPQVDIVFQDISQKNQVFIFIENMKRYMKKEGYGYLSLKCKSIDVTRRNKEILDESEELLKDNGFTVIKSISLAPFEKDHYLTIVQFKDSPNKVEVSSSSQSSSSYNNRERRSFDNKSNFVKRDFSSGSYNNRNNNSNRERSYSNNKDNANKDSSDRDISRRQRDNNSSRDFQRSTQRSNSDRNSNFSSGDNRNRSRNNDSNKRSNNRNNSGEKNSSFEAFKNSKKRSN